MSDTLSIPAEYRTLVGLLRDAVRSAPPDAELLAAADWPAVLRQARQHGVDTYLYPWLAEHAPALFSPRADVAPDSAPAAWRTLFLAAIPRALQRQRQLAELLAAFGRAGIDVMPLKGAWLSETVYDDPARRSMSDLDVLVRKRDLDACHATLLDLGYRAAGTVVQTDYLKDRAYTHTAYPCPVEVHWDIVPFRGNTFWAVDTTALWERSVSTTLLSHPVRSLNTDDQLLHLTLHILLHGFAMPLRGFLDIALLIKCERQRTNGQAENTATADPQVRRCLDFVLTFVSQLFNVPLPDRLATRVQPVDFSRLAQAFDGLAVLPSAEEHRRETMLVRLGQASPAGRVRFILSRIFLPHQLLAGDYPFARKPYGVPFAWLCRLRDLMLRYCGKIGFGLRPRARISRSLEPERKRQSLIEWLWENEKPG